MTDDMVQGSGRWLIVRNNNINPIHFRHPKHDAADVEHLTLGGFEAKSIQELWLDVPWFMDKVRSESNPDGRIDLYRSDDPPDNRFTVNSVAERLVQERGFTRNAALTVYQICASDPLPDELDQYIELAPSREGRQISDTYIAPRWDLVQQHLPFLEAVLEVETEWRKRQDLMDRLNKRIESIGELRR